MNKTNAQPPPAPTSKKLEGGPISILIAMGSGLAVAFLIAVPARPWVESHVPPGTSVPDQLFALEGFAAALLVGIGALLRALAHGRDDHKNMDFVGKLFTVGTIGFGLLAAQSKLLPDLSALLVTYIVVLLLVLIFGCLFIAVWQRNRPKARPAESAG